MTNQPLPNPNLSNEKELQELIQKIQNLQPDSRERQKLLERFIKKIQVPGILLSLKTLLDKDVRSLSGQTTQSDDPSPSIRYLVPKRSAQEELYADAKIDTFLWIRDNIDKYDPKLGTVKTWVNRTLCWKFLDAFNREYRGGIIWVNAQTNSLDAPEYSDFEIMALSQENENYRLILECVEQDPENFLKNILIRSRNGNQISLQELLLMRLEDRSLTDISVESGISIKTLSSSIKRHMRQLKDYITKHTGIEFDE